MRRSTAYFAFFSLCLPACGDDGGGAAEGDGSGSTSAQTASTGADTSGSSGGAETGVMTTGLDPENCIVQQGEGPCMVEQVVPVPTTDVVFGDFDGDGDVDILARGDESGPQEEDELILFPNDNGIFSAGTTLTYTADPVANGRSVSLASLRPMSRPEEAQRVFVQGTYGALGDVEVDVWLVEDGTLSRFYEPTATPPAGPWFGDVDGDGERDLIFAPDGVSLSELETHSCDAGGCDSASAATATGAPAGPWTILSTDTTGDALEDLLVVRNGDDGLEVVILGNDGGSFSNIGSLTLGPDLAPASSRLEDIDGDGRMDLMLTSTDGMPAENSFGATLSAFTQDGNGGLEPGPVIDAGERITGYAVADYNGDGTPDVALRRTDRTIINIGEGPEFQSGVSYELDAAATGITGQGIPTWSTAVLDLDGNGLLDILTVTAQSPTTYAVSVLRAVE
ncbi:MAG: VCBS repeat-containing protein [Myxococcota bacterium]